MTMFILFILLSALNGFINSKSTSASLTKVEVCVRETMPPATHIEKQTAMAQTPKSEVNHCSRPKEE